MRQHAFFFSVLLACSAVALPLQASANSGGGSASASAGAATTPLEPFIVNLSTYDRYLQVAITLQLAKPELADKIKQNMPVVRHNLIMLLSSKDSATIQSANGKHDLIEEIKDKINKVLDVKEHDGVTDVYFVNFVIQ